MVAVVVAVVASVVDACDVDDDHKGDDDDDDNDMLSAGCLDGVLEDRICDTLDPFRGAKEDGAPSDCRGVPDLDRQALGLTEVNQACTVCEANRPVHNDGAIVNCRTSRACRTCGTAQTGMNCGRCCACCKGHAGSF